MMGVVSSACLTFLTASSIAQESAISLTAPSVEPELQPNRLAPNGRIEPNSGLARNDSEAISSASAYESLRQNAVQLEQQFVHLKNLFRVVLPSVVHIEAIKDRDPNRPGRSVEEAGAGIIFDVNGQFFVITNRHVVVHAALEKIRLQFNDGRFLNPKQIWFDPGTDLAVMAIEGNDFESAVIGTSSTLEVGDFVVAIGSPFGLNHSASYGIISAKGRRDLQLGEEGVRYQDFLQTDAAINPGNSGGPLMNLYGEVVGINTAIASNSGANEGIGFAIPIDMAIKVGRDLVADGRVNRGFLGVSLDNAYTPDIATQIGLSTVYGARIAGITSGSPAERVSLEPGDVIMRFDGQVVESDSHLVHVVSMTPIGHQVDIEVYRNGEYFTVSTSVDDRKRFDPR